MQRRLWSVSDPWLLGAAGVGLVVRVVYVLTSHPAVLGDQVDYQSLGHHFGTYLTSSYLIRPPLYPLFLSINYGLGLGNDAVRVEQAILVTAACFLVSLVTARNVSPLAGRIAGGFGAVLPPLVTLPSLILSDSLAAALCAASLCVAVMAWEETAFEPYARKLALAALLAAAATLTHVNQVVVFGVVLAALSFGTRSLRNRGVALAVVIAAGGLLFVPWIARNVYRAGTPAPLGRSQATSTGASAAVHIPVYEAGGEFGASKRAHYYWFSPVPPHQTRAQALSKPLTSRTAHYVSLRSALASNLKHRPVKQLQTSLFWERELWLVAFDDHAQYGVKAVIPWPLTQGLQLCFLVLVAVGAWVGRRSVLVRLAVLLALLTAIPYLIFFSEPRYAIPALVTLLGVAGTGAAALVEWITRSATRPALAPVDPTSG